MSSDNQTPLQLRMKFSPTGTNHVSYRIMFHDEQITCDHPDKEIAAIMLVELQSEYENLVREFATGLPWKLRNKVEDVSQRWENAGLDGESRIKSHPQWQIPGNEAPLTWKSIEETK